MLYYTFPTIQIIVIIFFLKIYIYLILIKPRQSETYLDKKEYKERERERKNERLNFLFVRYLNYQITPDRWLGMRHFEIEDNTNLIDLSNYKQSNF